MVVVNPKNWHWVEKNTLGWSETYFQTKFIPLKYDHNDYDIEIIELDKISGDSNVSQRKGKVICYFDLNLKFKGQVTPKDNAAEPQTFTVTIPEFIARRRSIFNSAGHCIFTTGIKECCFNRIQKTFLGFNFEIPGRFNRISFR